MQVILNPKHFFLPMATFVVGMVLGKYLLAPGQNIETINLAPSTVDVHKKIQDSQSEEDSPKRVNTTLNTEKKKDQAVSESNSYSKKHDNQKAIADTSTLNLVTPAVRLALADIDKLYEQPKLYWHHQL